MIYGYNKDRVFQEWVDKLLRLKQLSIVSDNELYYKTPHFVLIQNKKNRIVGDFTNINPHTEE